MLTIEIPGFGTLKLEHLVLDYNGTLARDGRLDPDAARLLPELAKVLRLHVVTADTFGTVAGELGAQNCIAVGNGNNDRAMLESAALGITVLGEEGAATATVLASDLLLPSIARALELLLYPKRLIATLRK